MGTVLMANQVEAETIKAFIMFVVLPGEADRVWEPF